MESRKDVQHVYLVGAKSLGAYGGYETFVYKLTEHHQNKKNIKYHVACKANGDGCMLEKIIENEAVHAMLAVLTDKQRDLIHQQFVLGKTHQEIADDMGISRGSVTRAVNQALERIRRKFDFEAHYELAAGGLT